MILFGGIDPSGSENEPTACAVMDDDRKIVDVSMQRTDREIADFFTAYQQDLFAIGVDGPCYFPTGLYSCCFQQDDFSCQHEQPNGVKGRACERELAKQGIGCFFTVKKAFARGWILRSVKLHHNLTQLGYRILEVYPYASKRILFGRHIPKKFTIAGMQWLQDQIANLGIAFSQIQPHTHHEFDAIMAAITVYLHYVGKAVEVGDETEGRIIIPSIDAGKTFALI
jgi:predicted nuclease with RNAse H fold